ncbi:MAG: hypothetical protein V3U67_08500, partial [Gemmatimonadota bacterium]
PSASIVERHLGGLRHAKAPPARTEGQPTLSVLCVIALDLPARPPAGQQRKQVEDADGGEGRHQSR